MALVCICSPFPDHRLTKTTYFDTVITPKMVDYKKTLVQHYQDHNQTAVNSSHMLTKEDNPSEWCTISSSAPIRRQTTKSRHHPCIYNGPTCVRRRTQQGYIQSCCLQPTRQHVAGTPAPPAADPVSHINQLTIHSLIATLVISKASSFPHSSA